MNREWPKGGIVTANNFFRVVGGDPATHMGAGVGVDHADTHNQRFCN
jgi:hypothetical protein